MKCTPPRVSPRRQFANLSSEIALAKLKHQSIDAPKHKIPLEDRSDLLGLFFDDVELAILQFVAQRHYASTVDVVCSGICNSALSRDGAGAAANFIRTPASAAPARSMLLTTLQIKSSSR